MQNKAKKVFTAILIAAVAGAMYYYAVIYKKEAGPAPITTTGVVEALETNISSKIAGKLDFVGFREGDRVKKGDLVASLESADLDASVRQAEAAVRSAETSLASGHDAVENARAQVWVAEAGVKNAEAAVSGSEAQLVQAEKDLRRAKDLFAKGIISASDMDNAQTARDTKLALLDSAKASLAQARSNKTASAASLKQAQGNIATLKAGVAVAGEQADFQKAVLSYSKIYSPVDSVVEYRSLEPGEVAAPGTSILTLIDLDRLWVRMDLEQRFVSRVKAGQKAEITIEGMPGKVFEGTVFDIGREGEFAVERDVTRGRQDIKSFRTRMWVKDPDGILKPGMTVVVNIP